MVSPEGMKYLIFGKYIVDPCKFCMNAFGRKLLFLVIRFEEQNQTIIVELLLGHGNN